MMVERESLRLLCRACELSKGIGLAYVARIGWLLFSIPGVRYYHDLLGIGRMMAA